ncbi:tRNA 2-thiouridine synthesizing protein A [Sphingomonas guangdongensis]|uniref:tRNA 2-thiouridine synthesizing protein A n=1 Tax=Sphingomonas guangdongensis TaxID=1141890 RepID=A0A285QZN6_9SPHN|nr:sulfurtransferase TusA family protein [Sphingomonas guangdongensis]SOB87326.1 tRNA 2-thiouridine synthesizing protein A [Sphingomonas guangdongensis]
MTLDARGLRCPWPALRLARVLRDGAATVTLLADDPNAEAECRAVAEARGGRLRVVAPGRYVIEIGPIINALFTP